MIIICFSVLFVLGIIEPRLHIRFGCGEIATKYRRQQKTEDWLRGK
ncbi:MAG: hypothetical protein MRECE_1c147 [Mycoplasmataceae bacterium CE_OT135]|nr:MAG: hypothetical protein MRECE_1c019 [Mycoplasmataceae bacterium CE_OT135]KLL04367.1 MAG: hypothetical protein MRECE_1c147 [Mycoplasmataceae bacterium CE_OT135]